MKKTIFAAAAVLLTVGGFTAENALADDDGGTKITFGGDARFRAVFRDNLDFGNHKLSNSYGRGQKYTDSRIRLQIKATTPGGAYAVGRLRMADGTNENNDLDSGAGQPGSTWVDMAYIGVPLGKDITMELGKFRMGYGTGFFFGNLPTAGARGIIKVGDWEINPFVEWLSESSGNHGGFYSESGERSDAYWDHDAIRYGLHVGGKVDKWKFGAMAALQTDDRNEFSDYKRDGNGDIIGPQTRLGVPHKGWMANLYVDGKSGPFGLKAEVAYNDGRLRGFNNWNEDRHESLATSADMTRGIRFDDGFGAYIMPSYTIDALTLSLNLGFTHGGFITDTDNFGFIMIGSSLWQLTVMRPGQFGDTMWAGLIAKYEITDSVSLTGNFVYAHVNGDELLKKNSTWGRFISLDHAFELSGAVDWAITKSLSVRWAVGTLFASFDDPTLKDDNPWGSVLYFNYKI